ncbi:MAG TPA: beta-ketoacyl-ACP synthase III [Gemmatimonadales bacterium]|jgi:3-oxoacyl-[acyl-carrier-protein] synthase-3|nr:beta-ketoacyl-ACP synthase III [Gemmatimonadales bacterium]
MPSACFLGTGFAVPDRVVTNDDLSRLMDTSDEWIRTRTGIEERHWAREGETGAGLAHAASLRALEAAGLAPRELDAIVYATSTPDHFAPGNGVYLQRLLDVPGIPSIDLRNQCSGFVYALAVADAFIRAGTFRRVLVVGAEIQSTGMDVTTRGRNTAVIFADGAGAVILGPGDDGRGLLGFDLHGDGTYAEKLWVDAPGSMYHPRVSPEQLEAGRHFLDMDGKEVFRHAVARMPESVRAVLSARGYTTGDLALLVAHQANLRISEMIQKSLGLRDDQVYNNIMRYGNTTAATIPIALDECARSGRLQPGDLVALTAFGSGFLWGSALVRW